MSRSMVAIMTLVALGTTVASTVGALAVLPAAPQTRLETVAGSLERCDTGFCLATGPIDLGPSWYLAQTTSRYDLDGDGVLSSLLEELEGMIGREAVVEVAGDQPGSVYTLNGSPWRGFEKDPPWATTSPMATSSTISSEPVVTSVIGQLAACGTGFCLDDLPIYLGPFWYLNHGASPHDFDGDGVLGSPTIELGSLVGEQIEAEVRGDQTEVITLKGVTWQPVEGPPPWAGGPGDPEGIDEDGGGPPVTMPIATNG